MVNDSAASVGEPNSDCRPLVLVVDDDENHQKLMLLLAEQLGIQTHIAVSCHQAIDALQTISFDVILMDYRMPEVDGVLCTQRIRTLQAPAKVPIVAVTAHATPSNREIFKIAGLDDVLEKPFTLEQLQEKLDFWLKQKRE